MSANVFEHLRADGDIELPGVGRQSRCVTDAIVDHVARFVAGRETDQIFGNIDPGHVTCGAHRRGHHLAEETRSAADVDNAFAVLETQAL